jgi:sulfopyruvate decarboxylase subunit beta
MMKRDECLKILARHIPDDIVVPVYSCAFDWVVIRPHPLNFVTVGAMGLAAAHGLGLALGRPNRKVIVLDGDGSLLMALNTLVTVASIAPQNFYHFVAENGSYEVNGGHPTPGRGVVSFAGHARAAGYKQTYEFDDLEDFEKRIGSVLSQDGPIFVTLKVVAGVQRELDYGKLYRSSERQKFREAIAE